MRLKAKVTKVTGNTSHWQGSGAAGGDGMAVLPDPKWVEIQEQGGSVYLLRLDEEGECIADTWHETVENAKAQASFEYEIEENDWVNMDAQH